jgi:acyl carrier protein
MTDLLQAKRLLAEAITTEIDAVPETARIGEFERWDSLTHMKLLLSVEKQIGRQLDPDEAVRVECLSDIAALLTSSARTVTSKT